MNDRYLNQKIVKIKDIKLMENNPRYSFTEGDIDFKGAMNSEQNQLNSYEKLMESEEDFSKFCNLVRNISENGFSITEDVPPFLVPSNKNVGTFVVVEGNRRIFALKLLAGDNIAREAFGSFALPQVNVGDSDKVNEDEFKRNKDEIVRIINLENENLFDEITANVFEINELSDKELELAEQSLIELIVSRHSYAESSLKKEWSRTKMFYELKNRYIITFNRELKSNDYSNSVENTIDSLQKVYKREKKVIKSDLYNAFYVTKIIDEWLDQTRVDNAVEREFYIRKIKASSLELSLSKIKNHKTSTTLRRWVEIKTNYQFLNEKLRNDSEFLTIMNEGVTWRNLSKFIMYSYQNGFLDTRGFKFCKKGVLSKDEKLVELYSGIFGMNYQNTINEVTCEFGVGAMQTKLHKIITENDDIKDVVKNLGIEISENKNIYNSVSTFKEVTRKSKTIYNELYNKSEKIAENEEVMQTMSSAMIMEEVENSDNKYMLEELNMTLENFKKNERIKYSLYLSLERLIKYDFPNISKINEETDLKYDHSLFKLCVLVRSVIEMYFVYSGYFYKSDYEEDEHKSGGTVLNPYKIFGFHKNNFVKKDKILDFSFKDAKNSLSNIMSTYMNFYDAQKKLPKPLLNSVGLEKCYNFLQNAHKYNGVIHRFWAIPMKADSSTKFYSTFMNISKFIEDSIELIKLFIKESISWINDKDIVVSDPD